MYHQTSCHGPGILAFAHDSPREGKRTITVDSEFRPLFFVCLSFVCCFKVFICSFLRFMEYKDFFQQFLNLVWREGP